MYVACLFTHACCATLHIWHHAPANAGVSLQAQVLMAVVHICRYADLVPSALSGSVLSYQPSM